MLIDRLDRAGLRRLEAAVRAGEPVRLAAGARASVPMDEIVPMCHAVDEPELAPLLAPRACPGSGHRVTAIIPANRHRPIGLGALEAQDVEVEPLVLANGAWTEGTRVTWKGHGATRQLGVELARSPWVLFTVDDALPLGAGFVRTLVEALEEGGYDAVFARQIPWPTADAVTRARLRAWTPPGDTHHVSDRLDHVAALYRRDTLLRDPLDPVPIAEDWRWGRRHRVGYVPRAAVIHAHVRQFRELYRRTRDIHRERARAGETPTVAGLGGLLRALPGTIGVDAPGALGELLGQWVGGR